MIKVTPLQASKFSLDGTEDYHIYSFELEYPRFIHSEFMTHRVFSRNSASSRAIPVQAMHKSIAENPAYPERWGVNRPGMQDAGEVEADIAVQARVTWDSAMTDALRHSARLAELGLHKQVVNRLTEPFMHMKVVLTFTEYDNWKELRKHGDADPTIYALACAIDEHIDYMAETALELESGEWHVPYIQRAVGQNGEIHYYSGDQEVSVEQALMISASCCAQVSYRKNDTSLEKAQMIYDKLINSRPMHASPIEHQATPATEEWQTGVTHVDRWGNQWSGNFKNWIQYRQTL